MEDLSLWMYIAMFGVAFVAGFVDTIAGGGGLITLPVLLGAGVSPHIALATNRMQACFGSGMASLHFIRSGFVDIKSLIWVILWIFVCAAAGTFAVLAISPNALKIIIPFLLIIIFFYVLFSPKTIEEDRAAKLAPFAFYAIFGALLGFYDGFLGPGTGSFWTFLLIALLGLSMKKAVAQTKILNFASNIFSFFVYAASGNILWLLGLCMGAGQLIGARLGAAMVIKKEAKFIKKVFLIAVFCSICKLIYDLF